MDYKWLITIASLVGVVLNIKKNKISFYIWSVTNLLWMIIDFKVELYSQSALFGCYFLLSLWGIFEWHKTAKKEKLKKRRKTS